MKKLILATVFMAFVPQSVWASTCPWGSSKRALCEIQPCAPAGFPVSTGSGNRSCSPALAEAIKRWWSGRLPYPIPPECICSLWGHDSVIPEVGGISLKSDAITKQSPLGSKKYAQISTYNEALIAAKNAVSTNCPRSTSYDTYLDCTVTTDNSRMTFTNRLVQNHKKKHKRIYEFVMKTRPTHVGSDVNSEVRMRMRNGSMIGCTVVTPTSSRSCLGGYTPSPPVVTPPVEPKNPGGVDTEIFAFPQ